MITKDNRLSIIVSLIVACGLVMFTLNKASDIGYSTTAAIVWTIAVALLGVAFLLSQEAGS
jgi:hypothetical protein